MIKNGLGPYFVFKTEVLPPVDSRKGGRNPLIIVERNKLIVMKIFIIGATGFIGFTLARKLRDMAMP